MAGIYVHIPFCKQACHYCNFHFSTSTRYRGEMIEAILLELELRKDYLGEEPVTSIYIGGGTPSLLSGRELQSIFDKIVRLYDLKENQVWGPDAIEITLEANPDDLAPEKLKELKSTLVNRLSIGIQSFFDEDLIFMNRAHNVAESFQCIEYARTEGFDNLTIDLIYGSPTTTDTMWEKNVETAISLDVPHLSCYCLTVEPQTALDHFVRSGRVRPVDEEQAARQFELLLDKTNTAGYEQYEISNFARPGFYSKHNSSYWRGEKYLGIGPSAHSFDQVSRQWNVANNAKYMRSIREGKLPFEREVLTPEQRYNEYIMVTLRTSWGIDLEKIEAMGFKKQFLESVGTYIREGLVEITGNNYKLAPKAKFLADGIAAALFV